MWTRYGVTLTIRVPYLDPHYTFVSKIKSADICKDWVWGLTIMSDQRLCFKLKKNIIQEYIMLTEKCAKIHERSCFRPNLYQLFSYFKHR